MKPARLHKEVSWMDRIGDWAIAHAPILMPLAIVTLLALFVGLCFAIVGVSAVESGGLRNFLVRGV